VVIPPALTDAAVIASELFESLSIPHVIGGSVASSYYSEWRLTNDVDIAVDLSPSRIDAFVQRASTSFLVEPSFVLEAVQHKRMFTRVHRSTFVKMDVYVRARAGFFDSQLKRARLAAIWANPRSEVRIRSHEDFVLQKLLCYEQGGRASERHWRDVINVLSVWQDRLDEGYLSQWAEQLELVELLGAAKREASGLSHKFASEGGLIASSSQGAVTTRVRRNPRRNCNAVQGGASSPSSAANLWLSPRAANSDSREPMRPT